jgi:hypothetical protein
MGRFIYYAIINFKLYLNNLKTNKIMKQETLEEAIEQYAEIYRCPATNKNEYCRHDIISAVKFGAKWQQEKSYSEEDMINFIQFATQYYANDWMENRSIYELLEQFKNK